MRSINVPLLTLLLMSGLVGSLPASAADTESDNYFTRGYVSKNSPTVALQPAADGPKLYRGNTKAEDYQRMLRSGYELLGYSSFEAADVPPEQALEQARKVKADLVLVYTQQTGSVPMSVQIDQMREQAKKSGDQNGHTTIEMQEPAQQDRYAYFASYWVKLAPPVIGVHVIGPHDDDETKGLTVVALIKESPAERAGIAEGDLLTRIGDIALDKPEALSSAAQRYAGKTVQVSLQRNGSDSTASMTLNTPKQ